MNKKLIDPIRNLFRVVIRRIAHALNRITGGRLKPDYVTYAGVVMHLPIAYLIARGDLAAAAVLLFIFGLFDVLDGELARLQGTAGPSGMLLDATTDRVKEMLIYSGIAYYISTGSHASWAFLAVVACGASITVSYAKAKGEVALAIKHHLTDHHALNRHFKEALVPFEIRMTMILFGLLTGQIIIMTGIIAVLALLSVAVLLRAIARQL